MGQFIEPTDFEAFAEIPEEKALGMIEDAEAQAILTAPCITNLDTAPEDESPQDRKLREAKLAAVKSILRAAILRWNESGTGVTQTIRAGDFSHTQQYQGRRSMFWPKEIEQLQGICKSDSAKAFSVDTVRPVSCHLPWCSLTFGATYCSCGTEIAGAPIFEGA